MGGFIFAHGLNVSAVGRKLADELIRVSVEQEFSTYIALVDIEKGKILTYY